MNPETEQDIRSWVALQKNIQQHHAASQELWKQRSALEERILTSVRERNLQSSIIQMGGGRRLCFKETLDFAPISQKFLYSALRAAFVTPPTNADNLFKFILARRPSSKKWEIRQK